MSIKFRSFSPVVYAGGRDKSNFIAPPYDIINGVLQKKLYRKDPLNVIRLILGNKYPADSARRNSCTRAADFFNKWTAEKNIIRGGKGVFVLKQDFTLAGKRYSRTGVIVRLDWSACGRGGIIPHEKTYRKHRVGRNRLLKKLPLNFSPVFLITEGVSSRIKKAVLGAVKEAVYNVPGEKGVLFRALPSASSGLLSFLGKQKFVIADGHHRFRVSAENFDKDNSSKFLMVYICDFSDEGCVVLSHTDRKSPFDKSLLREVLKTGKLMKQKSTFFWPKLPSGLLMHPVKELKDES
ncbi:MAG: DUF1015 family protein [Elusimicrobiota bacterium]|nr:DUF1015 family protein [Elusimicrobiota bacterium]